MKYSLPCIYLISLNTMAADVHIDITGVEEGVGQVVVSVWDSEENYLETAFSTRTVPVAQLSDGRFRVSFSERLPETCAINVYYDMNSNGELDTNWLGIPNEPVGITNNAKGSFGPPSYEDGKVDITGEEQVFEIHVESI